MNRFLPILVFLVVAAIGFGMSFSMYRTSNIERESALDMAADDIADRLASRFNQHMSLLEATKAFFTATNGDVSRAAFKTYVAGLDTEDRYDGIQGIGFARMIYTGNEATAEKMIAENYDAGMDVWPEETDQDFRAPIVLLEPDDMRNRNAVGYDMYTEPVRREAMADAFASDTPRASGPVELVQEITSEKQTGFLLYLPFKVDNGPVNAEGNLPLSGFIYAPFRAGDLYEAVVAVEPDLPVAIEAHDQDAAETPLFKSENYDTALEESDVSVERTIDIAGRTWVLDVTPTEAFEQRQFDVTPFVIASVSLLLAVALALSAQSQIKALAAAREVQRLTEKSLQERELILQEMKHRIKNSIARMLAIARQTAHHSETLSDFMESYSARLQAMSTAQDVLTRSHWGRADLKELLGKELEQVFGEIQTSYEVDGPMLELDEKATQAFSLTFHELATNALKYGSVSSGGTKLSVSWRFEGSGKDRKARLIWKECGSGFSEPPKRKGFGTRLIDANIMGELQGTIERHYSPEGLTVEIVFPTPEEATGRKSRRGLKRRSRKDRQDS